MLWARLLVYDRLLVVSSWSLIVLCGFVTARALVPLPSALFQGQPQVGLGSSEIGMQSPTCCCRSPHKASVRQSTLPQEA